MTLSQLRTQVDTLCRKYAVELEVYRLRPLAQELCDEMAEAVTGPKPGPVLTLLEWIQTFLRRLIARGFRPLPFLALNGYLERCLDRRVLPQANDVLRALLPRAAQRGLIPRPIEPIPF